MTPSKRRPDARYLSLLVVGYFAACAAADLLVPPDPEPGVVTRVTVTPAAHTSASLGDTRQFLASAEDGNGNKVLGRTTSWQASATDVATVDDIGIVTTVGNGQSTITAMVDGVEGTAAISVSQVIVRIELTPAPAFLNGLGTTKQVSATALDGNDRAVAGAVLAWNTGNDQVASVDGTGTVTAISEGGTILSASSGNVSEDAVIVVSTARVAVSAGSDHTCGLRATGEAFCWGENFRGALGNGTRNDSDVPIAVSGGLRFASIVAGQDHTCGLMDEGVAYCWGYNWRGQLGDATSIRREVPVRVVGESRFFALSANNSDRTCGIAGFGDALCWGVNWNGELGNGTDTHRSVPTAVAGGGEYYSISTGGVQTCGVVEEEDAYCWGLGAGGAIGNGSNADSPMPALVSGGLDFMSVVSGARHVCGLAVDGSVHCWGENDDGELGNSTTQQSNVPVPVSGGLRFTSVDAGFDHTCGIVQGGDAYCWGWNADGQLGTGQPDDSSIPVMVTGGLKFLRLSTGGRHTCGVIDSNDVYCWGDNGAGQLGDSTLVWTNVPVNIVF